jgi:uncharacterized protein YndB with AHSA1/START domain
MIIADLSEIPGRTYPARRRTQNLVGGASPIQATNFSMGNVTLEPNDGQVPWHNQEQEVEVSFTPQSDGSTRVDLEHRHFDRHGEGWDSMRAMVDSPGGWGTLMDLYRARVES